MSHLHIADGILPVRLWALGLVLAVLLLLLCAWVTRRRSPQRLAYQGALGALVLAVMVLPLGPFEYHLTLVGPVGVLLGPAAVFQLVFITSAILALLGHGGFTVIGLNALVLGAGGALAGPVFAVLVRRWRPPAAMAAATAVAQAVSGGLWLAVMAGALRVRGSEPGHVRLPLGLAVLMWVVGILVESTVAFGIARFIVRVRPDLLPGAWREREARP
jgi:cobalt/nickel transport system permease protein